MPDLIHYTRHHVTDADRAAVDRVLRSSHLTQGTEVEAFEAALCEVTGAKYAVAVSSGTAALHCLYAAAKHLHLFPTQDRASGAFVTTTLFPAISFVATANAARWTADWSSIPISFADTVPSDMLADLAVWASIGGDIPAQMPAPLLDLAHALGAPVDFDAITGATYSFHPAKHATTGEGGAVCTNRADVAQFCRLFRAHGRQGASMVQVGYNYRLPDLNAALGRSQLSRVQWSILERRRIAAQYDEAFRGLNLTLVPHSARSSRHLYQVLVADRDTVAAKLRDRGIGTAVHYPVIPLQPWWRERGGYTEGQFPRASAWAARTLSLPLFPTLTDAEVQRVITAVTEVCG